MRLLRYLLFFVLVSYSYAACVPNVTGNYPAVLCVPTYLSSGFTGMLPVANGGTGVGGSYASDSAANTACGGSCPVGTTYSCTGCTPPHVRRVCPGSSAGTFSATGLCIFGDSLPTANHVPFVSAAGALGIDATDGKQFYRDPTTGNVGIGTIPTAKLDINGNIKISDNPSWSVTSGYGDASSLTGLRINKVASDTTSHGIGYGVNGVDQWQQGMDFETNNQNGQGVGVSDFVPVYRTGTGDMLRMSPSGRTVLGQGIGSPDLYYGNALFSLVNKSTATIPHIQDWYSAGYGGAVAYVLNNGTAFFPQFEASAFLPAGENLSALTLDTPTKGSSAGGPWLSIKHGGQEVARIKGTTGSGNNTPYLVFAVSPNTTAPEEVMRIANNGNVGIGTTNPGQKLDVNGTIAAAPGGTIPACKKYQITKIANGAGGCSNANGCWSVNGGTAVNATAGLTQDVTLFTPAAGYYVHDWSVETATACSGATTITTGLGTASDNDFYTAPDYDLKAAVAASNFRDRGTALSGRKTKSSEAVVGSLVTTVENIDQITAGCSVNYFVCWSVLQ